MLDTWFNSWRSMDQFARADVFLLVFMLINAFVIICERLFRFGIAHRQSRSFFHDSAGGLRSGELRKVSGIAASYKQSHVAAVIAAGFHEFISLPPEISDADAVAAAERALRRRRRKLSSELSLGLGTLSTIASSAPFIGLLGTVFGIMGTFRGIDMEHRAWVAFMASALAGALVTTAMGLVVAIPAVWFRNYLLDRLEVCESEMSNASLEVLTYLHAHPWCRQREVAVMSLSPHFLSERSWEIPYDRQRALLLMTAVEALYLLLLLTRGSPFATFGFLW